MRASTSKHKRDELRAVELDFLGHFSQKQIPATRRSGGELGSKFSLNFRDIFIRLIPSPDAPLGAGVPSFSAPDRKTAMIHIFSIRHIPDTLQKRLHDVAAPRSGKPMDD